MASKPSAYLVAMPKKAASHIQKSAPGPPMQIAVATPTILPVPMVAERAVQSAPKLVTSPSPSDSFWNIKRNALGRCKTCTKPLRRVSKIPVAKIKTINGQSQTQPSTMEMILPTFSYKVNSSIIYNLL